MEYTSQRKERKITDRGKYLKDSRLIGIHYGEEHENYYGATVLPVFLSSLSVFPSIDVYLDSDKNDKRVYICGRMQSPIVRIPEGKIAALEHDTKAFMYSSDMAAATIAVMPACYTGAHIVCVRSVYGPLNMFLIQYCKEYFQTNAAFVKGDLIEGFENAITDNTDLIILENPSSIVMSLQDIPRVVRIARKHNAKAYVDNTYCTPIFQNPLDLGVDIVMHTMSKYIDGHSGIIGGVLITNDKDLLKKLVLHRKLYGGILGPMGTWLAVRELRTIEVRLRQHEKNAMTVATFSDEHPRVKTVDYPSLPPFLQYDLVKKQRKGNYSLMSFEIDSTMEQTKKFCQALSMFKIGVSWGGFEGLVEMPCARTTDQEASWLGASANTMRIRCGLEGDDLSIAGLERAFSIL